MTQEQKDLLFKDLCTRLQYGVKGTVYAEVTDGEYDMNGEMIFYDAPFDIILDEINVSTEEIHVVAIGNKDTVEFIETQQTDGAPYTIDDIKLYLRPMSSITEEERQELSRLVNDDKLLTGDPRKTVCLHCGVVIDFHNSHHLDWRGLIPMGLALEAPEGMYKNE